jgi:hypothetical protein
MSAGGALVRLCSKTEGIYPSFEATYNERRGPPMRLKVETTVAARNCSLDRQRVTRHGFAEFCYILDDSGTF